MHILISSDGGVSWIKGPLKVDKISNMSTYLSFGSHFLTSKALSVHFLDASSCALLHVHNTESENLWTLVVRSFV